MNESSRLRNGIVVRIATRANENRTGAATSAVSAQARGRGSKRHLTMIRIYKPRSDMRPRHNTANSFKGQGKRSLSFVRRATFVTPTKKATCDRSQMAKVEDRGL